MHQEGLDTIVVEHLGLDCEEPDLSAWSRVVAAEREPQQELTLAFVGKYLDLLDAYKSLIEAIKHAGIHTRTRVNINYIDAEDLEEEGVDCLASADAILVPGGFGRRGFEGKILAAGYARENGVPYLGICYGLHAAIIDIARHRAGLTGAHSTEIEDNRTCGGGFDHRMDRPGRSC